MRLGGRNGGEPLYFTNPSGDLALDVVLNEGASTDCCSEVPPPIDCDGYARSLEKCRCFFEVGFFDNEPCLGGIWVVTI